MIELRPIDQLYELKYQFKNGLISYDEVKEKSEIPLKELNESMRVISKKYNKKHTPVSFGYFFR